MKIADIIKENILNEYKEHLDTSIYGEWITGKGDILPVSTKFEHDKTARNHRGSTFPDTNVYQWAYGQGWVKITHARAGNLEVVGSAPSLKKFWPLIRPTAIVSDYVRVAMVEQVPTDRGPRWESSKEQGFTAPDMREKLDNFINGL